MKQAKALIVEDDPQIADILSIHIKDLFLEPTIVSNGLMAKHTFEDNKYDLILLDLMLPGMNGIDLCKLFRSKSGVPIIMITAKSEEIDKVLGLETGADDYLVKPFSIRELQARIKSVMRRSQSQIQDQYEAQSLLNYENLSIDLEKRTVLKNQQRLDLTNKEFDLLALLSSNPGKSFNRQSLLNLVWGYDFEGFEHTVNSHINRLRVKIEDDMTRPNYILTSWGFGYRFNEDII